MVADLEDTVEEDSRTATFDRKRSHTIASRDECMTDGSTTSTPRKRNKHVGRLGYQDVRDFVPSGGSFSTSTILLEDVISNPANEGVEGHSSTTTPTKPDGDVPTTSVHMEGNTNVRQGSDDVEDDRSGNVKQDNVELSKAKIPPPRNWNEVDHVTIRTKLGAGRGREKMKDEGQTHVETADLTAEGTSQTKTLDRPESQRIPVSEKPQDEATRLAVVRLAGFRERLAGMDPHDGPISAYKAAKLELENAEVDYNYCLFYPLHEEFVPPPTTMTHEITKNSTKTQERRSQMWNLVKQCMKKGTLEALKTGKLYGSANLIDDALDSSQKPKKHNPRLGSVKSIMTSLENSKLSKDQASDIISQSNRLRNLVQTFKRNRLDEDARQKVQEAQADLNYCQYFPSSEQYLPIRLAKDGLHTLIRGDNQIEGDAERRATQLWGFIQQCAQNGTLQDLKDGRLELSIPDVQTPIQTSFLSAPLALPYSRHPNLNEIKDRIGQALGAPLSNIQHTDTLVSDVPAPHLLGSAPNSTKDFIDATASNDPEKVTDRFPEAGKGLNAGSYSPISDSGLILNTSYDTIAPSVKGMIYPRRKTDRATSQHHHGSAAEVKSQGRVSQNTVSEDSSAEDDSVDADSSTYPSNPGWTLDPEGSGSRNIGVVNIECARTLADLNPKDLNAQIRYFHYTKSNSEIDQNTLVKCLVCAQHGHMAPKCEQLTCKHCATFNQHHTSTCPLIAKCTKCREVGHDRSSCPYKLKVISQEEIVCDLCQRNGHIEEDCELVWRTSGRPWDSTLAGVGVHLSCYECGKPGHLGNDCPSRKPGKSMGTSTWSSGKGQISIKSKNEISIKGSARQHPIDLDVDEEEDSTRNFIRPKVPAPVNKGTIQIKTGSNLSDSNPRPYSGWTPVNASYNQESAPGYQRYSDNSRGGPRAAGYQYNGYRTSDRRSMSPGYHDGSGYTRSDRYQPPPEQPQYRDRRPPPGADMYRPMPSSAQHAWSKHRL